MSLKRTACCPSNDSSGAPSARIWDPHNTCAAFAAAAANYAATALAEAAEVVASSAYEMETDGLVGSFAGMAERLPKSDRKPQSQAVAENQQASCSEGLSSSVACCSALAGSSALGGHWVARPRKSLPNAAGQTRPCSAQVGKIVDLYWDLAFVQSSFA